MTTTTTTVPESAAAAAFAARLPTAGRTGIRPSHSSGDTGDAVIVSSVGEVSAEIAVQLLDASALVDGSAEAPLTERLHDALESAASALGPCVLGEPVVGDASALFSHPSVQVYDLVDETDRTIGRLAVRVTRAAAAASSRRLHRIAGVEVDLTVEIGRTRRTVRDVLDLEPGRIIELDRSAGAPADVKLNGRLIAHGEVVVVDQDYAVRITRIIENTES